MTLAGWQEVLSQRLNEVGWSEPWFRASTTAVIVIIALIGWWKLAGRYALKAGVNAGTLTVSLEPSSSSYFDQYLDEIMYFFQVSKARIVLIEDVDRFGDAVVFDTLRALNTLVNSSGQVGRRVVFVYAIRDSVLGQIGTDKKSKRGPRRSKTALGIDRANRAKYFDVIIPMVPFVTADNARDLMMQAMKAHVKNELEEDGISPALIRLAARHVADMRTIWSIRNEFEVHVDRLMTSAPNVMPGINKDIILSLVLLRATSPDAYERIRLGTSPLDTLAQRWIDLVEANIESQTKNLTTKRTELENGSSLSSRAARAGELLDSMRAELLPMTTSITATQAEFSGPLTDADLGNVAGWQQIASGTVQTVILSSAKNAYGTRTTAQVGLSPQMVGRLIGMPLDIKIWQDADGDSLDEAIASAENEISFLRHHTWEQLYARTDLTVPADDGELTPDPKAGSTATTISFAGLAKAYAPTSLAGDLIGQGFLPRHYARYASTFYGGVVGPNAAEYIARAIEPGVPIIEYELEQQSVIQIFVEQGADRDDADLFDDPSVYNLDMVRYLLAHRPAAANRIAGRLANTWGELEQKFVGRFFQRESKEVAGQLADLMAPNWSQALAYVSVDAELPPEVRLHLFNSALGAVGDGARENAGAEVGRYLSDHYAELPALTDPSSEDRAAIVMAVVAEAGATIQDLSKLEPTALAAAAELGVYPVTSNNLEALGGADQVALDILLQQPQKRPVYDRLVSNLGLYLDGLTHLDPPGTPIKEPADFPGVLNDFATIPGFALFDEFVAATPVQSRAIDLSTTASDSWPALVRQDRTDPTFANIENYLSEYGLDDAVGQFLVKHAAITLTEATPQPDRLAMAIVVLAAREEIPQAATRVKLAKSLAPGVISIQRIAPEDADLVGPLIAAKLLADEPATFDAAILKRSENLHIAIAASDLFGDFSDATTMPPRHLATTLMSQEVTENTKAALILKLVSLLVGATAADATVITEALSQRHEPLDVLRIEALRVAGASTASVVSLLATQGADFSLQDLRSVLFALGDDYARLSTGGKGTVRFALDDNHAALLKRLTGMTHTGASEGHTIRHGTKLEASLKQAP
ncbi:MAG: hypothetical protein JWP85_1952 [Rhodoglobus sp.]|nr:hypothetical protein [Rhodoglobus sp.]